MVNIDIKLFPYQSRTSIYNIQSSIISLIILLFFAYANNLIIFGQKTDSQFSEQNINIVSAGDFTVMMKQKTLSITLFLLIQN